MGVAQRKNSLSNFTGILKFLCKLPQFCTDPLSKRSPKSISCIIIVDH